MAYKDIEKRKRTRKIYRERIKDKLKLQRLSWDLKYLSQPQALQKRRTYLKRYYEANKERLIKGIIKWKSNNPDKLAVINQVSRQNRRKRVIENGGSFTKQEWISLKNTYGNRCASCLIEEPDIKLTVDHIIPVSIGGKNNIGNIQPLCMKCNLHKSVKIIKYDLLERVRS